MPGLSLREAAREAGRSKSAILRAIQAGRLSATRLDDGGWSIDPSELFRVYEPPKLRADGELNGAQRTGAGGEGHGAIGDFKFVDSTLEYASALALLEQQVANLRERLTEMKERVAEMKEARDDARRERDAWRGTTQSAIARPLMLAPPDAPPARRSWLPWRRAG